MRVIAGCARGIHLSSPKGEKTRPIQDRTKESLFSILSGVIPGSCVIDLYAGTGAIGIEALSRGASLCIFVEIDKSVALIIKKNLEATKLQDKALVLKNDVFEIVPYLEKNDIKVDIVFASPPYPLVEKTFYRDKLLGLFSDLCAKQIIQPEGIIVFQHRKADIEMTPKPSNLDLWDTRTYGDTQISFFKNKQM